MQFNGTSTISNQRINPVTVTSWDLEYTDKHRLFYSNKRARSLQTELVGFPTNREYYNIPYQSHYQTGTLPYNDLTLEANTGLHPLEEETVTIVDSSATQGKMQEKWLSHGDIANELKRYELRKDGTIGVLIPATVLTDFEYKFQDENYTGGFTYILDGENRDPKIKDAYLPELLPVEIRMMVTYNPPLGINQNFNYKTEEHK